jgi:type III secretory pathway component EscV
MKILTTEKQEIIRLTIKDSKNTEYLNLIETTHEQAVKYIQNLFKEFTIKTDNKTTVDLRHCIGSINGKSVRVSLFDIGAKELKQKIIENLTK